MEKEAQYAFNEHYGLDSYWCGCCDFGCGYWSENKTKIFLETRGFSLGF